MPTETTAPTKFRIYNRTSGRLEIPGLGKVLAVSGWADVTGPLSRTVKVYAGRKLIRIEEKGDRIPAPQPPVAKAGSKTQAPVAPVKTITAATPAAAAPASTAP